MWNIPPAKVVYLPALRQGRPSSSVACQACREGAYVKVVYPARLHARRRRGVGRHPDLPAEDSAWSQPVSVSTLSKEAGLIRPELHGQFAEHLGTCIYGGLWVGKDSPIPNIDGYRKQAVEYLKGLVPVLRWPGGCFADGYHWRERASVRWPGGPKR